MPVVTAILETNVREGEGKKGHWSMDRVQLDDGSEIQIFTPIAVDDEVESYDYNGYTNWRKVGTGNGGGSRSAGGKTNDEIWAQNVEVIKRLDRIEAHLNSIIRQLKLKNPTEEIESLSEELTPGMLDDIPF